MHRSIELSFQKMEKTNSLKFTGNEYNNQHSTFAGLECAKNTDLIDRKAKVAEEQKEPMAYQGSKSHQNLGLVSKIWKFFSCMDVEVPEPNQRRRVSLYDVSMSRHQGWAS